MKKYLTKERLEEIKKELTGLKSAGRKEITERLKHAKDLGDLSENSEFHSAREDQRLLEKRINELENLIREAVLIQKPNHQDVVKIGSTLKIQKNKQIFTYCIVGSEESKPEEGLISNESPLGKAFLNKKVGEIIPVKTPRGAVKYKILKIE